jgi:hypothetical protein
MLKREDYKAIKHMDKKQLEAYLQKVYSIGFNAGVKKSMTVPEKPEADAAK